MEIESVRIFVKVIELGSFSKAAEALRLPKSTVSRTVSRLESETATRLILRTTRNLKLTAAGLAFYESCSEHVKKLEDARRSLQGSDSIVAGKIKITAPEDLGVHALSPLIGEIVREHKALSFELVYTDEVVDIVQGGYDFALRLGQLKPSRFRFRKLGEVILIPVASPSYLAKSTKIREPKDLTGHSCIAYSFLKVDSSKWTLRSKKAKQTVTVNPRLFANQMVSLLQLAVQGAGVTLVPQYLCRSHIESGELIRVLPDWSGDSYQVSLISPHATSTSARLKIVGERISEGIRQALI